MIFGTAKDLQSRAARAADSVTRLCIGSSFDLGLAIRKLEAHFWPRGCRSSTAYRKTHSFGRMGKLPSRAHSWSPLNTNMDMPTSRHLSFTFLNTSNDNYGWPERSLHEKSVVGLTGIQPKLTKLCCQLVAHCWLVAVLQSTQIMIYSQLTALKLSDSFSGRKKYNIWMQEAKSSQIWSSPIKAQDLYSLQKKETPIFAILSTVFCFP